MKKKRLYRCVGSSLPEDHPNFCTGRCSGLHREPHEWFPTNKKESDHCFNEYGSRYGAERWKETKRINKCDCYTLNTIEKLKYLILLNIIKVD